MTIRFSEVLRVIREIRSSRAVRTRLFSCGFRGLRGKIKSRKPQRFRDQALKQLAADTHSTEFRSFIADPPPKNDQMRTVLFGSALLLSAATSASTQPRQRPTLS